MSYRVYLGIFISLILMISFQNCQEGFAPIDSGEFGSSGGPNNPPGGPAPTQKPDYTYEQMKSCKANAAVGIEKLAACAHKNANVPAEMTQELVNTCVDNVGDDDLKLANCLTKNGVAVHGYREVKQWDIENCSLAVGQNKIAACMYKNGIRPKDVDQAVIDTCISAVGINNVEKCLRKNGYIKTRNIVTQWDIKVCNMVSGLDTLGFCLSHSEVPVGVATQNDLASCADAVGIENVSKCLRVQGFVPKTLQKVLVMACNEDVGPDRIAHCLKKNGQDIESFPGFPEDGQTGQDVINDCISAVGVENVAKCLRVKKIANRVPTTDDLYQCQFLVGQDAIVNCLDANGMKTATLEQEHLDTCIGNVTIDNAVGCLKLNGYLPYKISELVADGGVLKENCMSCHSNARQNGPAAGFDMNNWDHIASRITPGDLSASLMYQRMTNSQAPMPVAGLLEAKLIRQIEAWILHGE